MVVITSVWVRKRQPKSRTTRWLTAKASVLWCLSFPSLRHGLIIFLSISPDLPRVLGRFLGQGMQSWEILVWKGGRIWGVGARILVAILPLAVWRGANNSTSLAFRFYIHKTRTWDSLLRLFRPCLEDWVRSWVVFSSSLVTSCWAFTQTFQGGAFRPDFLAARDHWLQSAHLISVTHLHCSSGRSCLRLS